MLRTLSMRIKPFLAVCLVGTLGTLFLVADSNLHNLRSHLHGTSIFHWTVRAELTPEIAGDSAPYGTVRATHKQQGKADSQGLRVVVRRLQPNTTYKLWAWTGDLPAEPPPVEDYIFLASFQSGVHGGYVGKYYFLPEELDPLQNVKEVIITDEFNVVVLRANLTEPERWQFLFRRELDEDDSVDADAEGVLRLKSHYLRGSYRLYLAGLEPDTAYSLVVNDNDEEAEIITTDEYGTSNTLTVLENPYDMLKIQALSIKTRPEAPEEPATVLSTVLLDP
jgi:hypothetical protein